MKTSGVALSLLVALAGTARADVLHVPKDFATIQAAIDAAVAGDEIVVAAGTYDGVVHVNAKSDLLLRGKGKVVLTSSLLAQPLLTVSGGDGITLDHLRVAEAPEDAILVELATNVTLRHVRIEDPGARGIHVTDCVGVDIEHLDVVGAVDEGMVVETTDDLSLRHASFEEGGADGVRILDGVGALVEHVTVTGSAGSAFDFGEDTSGAILRKCVVHDANPAAVEAHGTGTLVEDNRFYDLGNRGVDLGGGTASIVRKNRIVRPAIYGVFLVLGTHQVLENRIVQAGEAGVQATFGPSQVISGNRVVKSLGDGIVVGTDADGCTLVDNKVVSADDDGIEVLAQDVQAVGNRVNGSAEDGFVVLEPGGVFVGNKAKGSGGFDLFDATAGGSTYADNVFGTTHFQ